MKAFVVDAKKNGRYVLPYQIEGAEEHDFVQRLIGSRIVSFEIPARQSLSATWKFRMMIDGPVVVEFSSACTSIGEWQETGSLNVSVSPASERCHDHRSVTDMKRESIECFNVCEVFKMVYESKDVYAECGIRLVSAKGEELIIVAGPSPGSVTVRTPFNSDEFRPEYDEEDYRMICMSEPVS